MIPPTAEELDDEDELDKQRIGFVFAKRSYARLIELIDEINTWTV